MISIESHIGKIEITEEYIRGVVRNTVKSCFGVAGLNSGGFKENILSLMGKKRPEELGVSIRSKNGIPVIDLHITVAFGTNISAVAESIRNKTAFAVKEAAGTDTAEVNVYIDNMNV